MRRLIGAGGGVAFLVQGATTNEPWLTKRELAEHYGGSVRSVERAMAEGMPHTVIWGAAKFRVSEVEPWLEATGHLDRRDSVTGPIENGAGTAYADSSLTVRRAPRL